MDSIHRVCAEVSPFGRDAAEFVRRVLDLPVVKQSADKGSRIIDIDARVWTSYFIAADEANAGVRRFPDTQSYCEELARSKESQHRQLPLAKRTVTPTEHVHLLGLGHVDRAPFMTSLRDYTKWMSTTTLLFDLLGRVPYTNKTATVQRVVAHACLASIVQVAQLHENDTFEVLGAYLNTAITQYTFCGPAVLALARAATASYKARANAVVELMGRAPQELFYNIVPKDMPARATFAAYVCDVVERLVNTPLPRDATLADVMVPPSCLSDRTHAFLWHKLSDVRLSATTIFNALKTLRSAAALGGTSEDAITDTDIANHLDSAYLITIAHSISE